MSGDPTGAEAVRWDLSDLYDGIDDPQLWADLDAAEAEAEAFRQRHHGHVAELDAAALAAAVVELEGLEQRLARAGTFIHLLHATRADDPEVGAALTRVQERGTAIGNRLLFFQLEWQAVADETADRLLADPALGEHRHFLETARRYRPYRLSEPEERVLAEKQLTARSAWTRLFDETFTRLRFEMDGESLSEEEILARLKREDRATRQRAAATFTRGLDAQLPTLGALLLCDGALALPRCLTLCLQLLLPQSLCLNVRAGCHHRVAVGNVESFLDLLGGG